MPMMPDMKGMGVESRWEMRRRLVEAYNNTNDVLKVLYAGKELKNSVVKMFLNSHDYSFSVISIIFKMMQKFYLPKLQLIKLLGKSIIIPEEEVNTYEELFAIYKRIKYLVSISENWMNSQHENE
jgi:hypothetical protein